MNEFNRQDDEFFNGKMGGGKSPFTNPQRGDDGSSGKRQPRRPSKEQARITESLKRRSIDRGFGGISTGEKYWTDT